MPASHTQTHRGGYPGCPPAASARSHSRAKNREGDRVHNHATGRQTPHGRQPPACGQAAQFSDAEAEFQGARPVPVSIPEPWEATAVDLTRCDNRSKNRAWRRIKSESPDVAQAMQHDIPALQQALGITCGVFVAADYIKE